MNYSFVVVSFASAFIHSSFHSFCVLKLRYKGRENFQRGKHHQHTNVVAKYKTQSIYAFNLHTVF